MPIRLLRQDLEKLRIFISLLLRSLQRNYFDFPHFPFSPIPSSSTNLTMSRSRELFFSFLCYTFYVMIKAKKIIWLLRHDQEKNVSPSRHYVQCAVVTEKEIWFLLHYYFDYATIMRKNILFYFTATFTLEISSYMILHLSTTLNTLLTCRKNSQTIYSPEKTCVTCEISSGISMEPCMIYVPT